MTHSIRQQITTQILKVRNAWSFLTGNYQFHYEKLIVSLRETPTQFRVKSQLFLLLLVLGVGESWGQTGYSGVYYIASQSDYTETIDGNGNFYLVPAANPQQSNYQDAYYSPNYAESPGDPEKPFLTTYKTNKDMNSIWIVKKTGSYYYIIHAVTGKYVIYEVPLPNDPNKNNESDETKNGKRKTMHLQTPDDEAGTGTYRLSANNNYQFNVTLESNTYRFQPINRSGWYWNPASGNKNTYYGQNATLYHNGMVGVYNNSSDNGSQWRFENAKLPAPTIEYDTDNDKFVISYDKIPAGFDILYTTDGSEPTIGGITTHTFTNETAISLATIGDNPLKAVVVRYGLILSETASIKNPNNPTIAPVPGDCNNMVAITADEGTNIYYTLDGIDPTSSSTYYTGPLALNSAATIKAIAYSGNLHSGITTYNYSPNYSTKPTITTTIQNTVIVTLSGTGAIYYTIDGTEPTTSSTQYTNPFPLTGGNGEVITIRAVAKDGSKGLSCVAQKAVTMGYFISNLSQLEAVSSHPGDLCILAADINASGFSSSISNFTGVFDGGYHTISGLSKPLFDNLNGGTVKNVVFSDVGISGFDNAGAICCEASGDTRIYNCGVKSGTISGTNAGSIVGKLDGNARVINCYSFATVSGGTWGAGIVGYNSFSSTRSDLRTMVMNCMFYGEISSNSKLSPIYGGEKITNVSNLNGYNYYRFNANYSKNNDITDYNCALAAEEDYLTRFEFFRNTLNSNRELAAWYATDNPNDGKGIGNACKMAKWVLDPADKPYPILKAQDYYPSFINYEDAPNLGTIDLTINESNKTTGGEDKPNGASINSNYPTTLTVYDKDLTHKHFNYRTVRLPYYNEVGTGNCTHNKVVTGWKITGFSGGTQGHFVKNVIDYSGTTHDEDEYPPYNFADRYCTDKDKYAVSGRVFSQGAYYDVPEGVTGITIEPYWGAAVYLSDPTYDVAYPEGYGDKNVNAVFVSNMGSRYVGGNTASINDDNQTVYTDYDSAFGQVGSSGTVYDNAIVLVGNYHHYWGQNSPSTTKAFTIMSADLNNDCEPDYSFIVQHGTNRQDISAIRFDFINSPGLGMIQKVETDKAIPKHGIWYPKGWFEVTNTTLIQFTQFEYDNGGKPAGSPLILLGGIYDQFVTSRYNAANSTEYIHLGGNIWMKEFCNGTHTANTNKTRHIPISVTGGEFESFYLTGTFRPSVESVTDNAECYINGGKFGDMAGAGQEQLKGDVTWLIDHADITNFYGGGINDQKPVLGHIYVEINNSNVGLYCGGPKFGNMQDNMKVTTKAKGSTFGNFYGAGYGGTSYFRDMTKDVTGGNDWGTWNADYTRKYVAGKGISTEYECEFIPYSGGQSGQPDYVGRFYVLYASLSLAKTKNVESTLEDCHITGSFYGGGKLGSVDGNITSTLKNCTVDENVFGAGFSASVETVNVVPKGTMMKTNPAYNESVGVFTDGTYPDGVEYKWTHAESVSAGKEFDNKNHLIYTTTNLTGLGVVTGSVTLTIDGNTVADENGKVMKVEHSVYGGGEESAVNGNTSVTVTGGTIGTTGKGGAEYGNVYGGGKGKADDVTAGIVKGSTNVSISGSPTILHNIYGGGAYGSVGDFTYDATSGMPTALHTENTGVCNIAITGGTIGTNGKENGMIFGSSRGDVATPEGEPAIDPNDRMAWVYSTNVTIGTQSETPSLTTPKIAGSIYGSGENGHTFQNTEVTIHSGTIGITEGETITDNNGTPDDTSDDKTYSGAAYPYRGNVYGGGCGTDMYWIDDNGNGEKDAGEKHYNPIAGIVRGNATVTIDGGHVVRNVYGAGAMGSVGNETEAESASTSGKTIVTIKGKAKIGVDGDDNGNVYGAARGDLNVQEENYANVRETELEINDNADIKGSAFGGGEAGIVWESVTVNMKGGSVANDIYGGGALAHTQMAYTIPANAGKTFTTNVNLTGGTIGRNVYGGGLGRTASTGVDAVEAKVYGKVLVALNEPKTTTTGEGESAVTTTTYGDCEVKKNIFGCNNLNGSPQDEVTVHIYKTVSKDESGNVKDKPEKNSDTYEVKAVYGGGNLAAYEPKATDASANVIIDGCGLTSIETVYGGGNAASTPATNVTVNGTYEIEEVFGGGNGKDAITINGVTKANPGANVGYKDYSAYETSDDADNGAVTKELRINNYAYGSGAANVNIYGGTIHRVFGGSNTKGNVRISAVTMLEEVGCEFCVDEAYGGGKSAPMDAEAKLLMACIPGLKEAYGGAKNAEIDGDVTLTITNGTFNRVFGGNDQAGYIKGTITVNIEETGCKPVIIGELYGGGNLAPYTAPAGKHGPTLNVRSFTSIGDIYGGGLGSEAEVTGDTYVNINVCEGRWKDGTYKYATAPSEVGVNDKITELNAKGYHAPSFTSGIGVIHTVFGGGNAAPVIGNTNVFIGTKSEEMFLTPTKKTVTTGTGDAQTTQEVDTTDEERTHAVKGADIRGNVYGGGNNATVSGNTNVVIAKEESVTPAPDPAPDPAPEPEP